jgi:hypothetical protein
VRRRANRTLPAAVSIALRAAAGVPAARGAAAASAPDAESVHYRRWQSATLVTTLGPAGAYSRVERRMSEEWARADGSGWRRSTCLAAGLVGPVTAPAGAPVERRRPRRASRRRGALRRASSPRGCRVRSGRRTCRSRRARSRMSCVRQHPVRGG